MNTTFTKAYLEIDRLRVEIYPTRQEMGAAAAHAAAKAIREVLGTGEECNIIFAAAPSQNELLAGLANAPGIEWERVNAFHMDEYTGLAKGAPQAFSQYLKNHLFGLVPLKNAWYIDGTTTNPAEEIKRYTRLLKEHPIHLCCLGIGENGHIAFNDPPDARFDEPVWMKEVRLDEQSRVQQVHDGCFERLGDVPKTALTLTVPALMAAGQMVCVVPGTAKADAVKTALAGPVEEGCPASILRRHPAAQLYLDGASAALI